MNILWLKLRFWICFRTKHYFGLCACKVMFPDRKERLNYFSRKLQNTMILGFADLIGKLGGDIPETWRKVIGEIPEKQKREYNVRVDFYTKGVKL